MSGQPKPAFYAVVLLVVLALLGYAAYRFQGESPAAPDPEPAVTTTSGDGATPSGSASGAEAPDDNSVATTVQEYSFVPAQRLPEVKGVANYRPMQDRTVRMALNVWAGWAPIVYANRGHAPQVEWKDADGNPFKVELVLIDDPVAMRDAFAAGEVHTGWATVDMLPLLLEGLRRDSRTMPRVYQQIDWSNGGDGIVVRDTVKSAGDLRGKSVVLAQNSPSHFFLLNALINAGVDPKEVDMRFTPTAFEAAAAFNADKRLAGVVTWAPDIYNLAEAKGNRMLVTTGTANKLIADVWFARADFAREHPAIIEGLVRGIFDAMLELESQAAKTETARLMASFYGIPADDALAMLADAHSTNVAENRDFFLNQNNPTNFERTYDSAAALYRRTGVVGTKVPFDQIVDFSVLQKLLREPKYANQTSNYGVNFVPLAASAIQSESPEILTKTVVVQFFPNSADLSKRIERIVNGKPAMELYDPNVGFVIEEVGKLAGQYGAARIVIEGHTDASMQGQVPESAVKELALSRSNAVKAEILKKFPTLQANQFSVEGVGWARPADRNDPGNHAKNRRVEVKVYPLEAQ